jgi:hypothetical protein
MDHIVQAVPKEQLEAFERQKAEEAKAAATAPPQFVDQERSVTIPLSFPITYDGKTYAEVTITRPTIRQWRKYMRECAEATMKHGPDGADLVDPPYLDMPAAVFNSLDFSDGTIVDATVNGFFGASSSPEEGTEDETNSSTSTTGEPSPS